MAKNQTALRSVNTILWAIAVFAAVATATFVVSFQNAQETEKAKINRTVSSSLHNAALQEAFQDLPQYPGLEWHAPELKDYKGNVGDRNSVLGYEITSTWIDAYDQIEEALMFYRDLEKELTRNGWQRNLHADADSPLGSQWGYQKGKEHIAFRQEIKYAAEDERGVVACPCHYRLVLFVGFEQ